VGARKVGVEEELLLVDPDTGRTRAVADRALRVRRDVGDDEVVDRPGAGVEDGSDEVAEVESELFRQQLETMTEPCTSLDDLAAQLSTGRRTVCGLADEVGAAAVAVPAPVLAQGDDGDVTNEPRYRRIRAEFGELARTSLVCGMHVHVEVTDADEGVRVINRIRPWLPVVLAVSANSPYHHGHDTGYASWRTQIWTRWPTGGSGEPFGTAAVYDEVRQRLTQWGVAFDDGMLYFDARLSANFPTIEVRVADVCTDLEDAVLVAALVRALVTAAAEQGFGVPECGEWRSELLRAATWRASRHGLADRLVHPTLMELAPAREVLESLVALVRPALEEAGDLALVRDLVERLLTRGNGATRQRRVFEAQGSLGTVVTDLCARTRAADDARPDGPDGPDG